ncbi:MAG: tyrosine-type recombinase/integrase [Candidatus Nanoarchaeia archaeon]|nr:tyrosine-type recombinase/integrase [Candidatus Nanoarchaeia archaeon]MDD5740892.1 tyrosine-type recombinase/integrase [Candidatus Nanoarchaeia archaeon]
MKIDPHKHKERYFAWKDKIRGSIPDISKINSDLILHYIDDMEKGLNIARGSVKGARSYPRLNNLRQRMVFLSKKFKELYQVEDITKIKEEQLISLFSDMQKGIIKRENGQEYKSVDTYARVFKAFWHWYQKVNKKQGTEVLDITLDLDTKQEKPKWVYLTEEQVRKLCDNAKYEYKVLFMFLFDTGIRSPTELFNVKVSDLYNDFKELQIREETSKTFGRRIKLMICSELIKEYVKSKDLKPEDYLFNMKYSSASKYLKRLAARLFGNKLSEAGGKYSEMSLYDFRHISCCYWLPRYKSESALKYRFGWKQSDKIHYYSELLGMKDTISQEDMLIDVTKTEIEKRLMQSEKRNQMIEEDNKMIHKQMSEILELFGLFKTKFGIYEQIRLKEQQIETN